MTKSFSIATGLVVGALLAGAPAARAVPGGVDLLSATGATIRFGVTPDAPVFEPSAADPSRLKMSVPGWTLDGAPGQPRLPLRMVRVAVPPTGGVHVSAFASAAETRSGVNLERNAEPGGGSPAPAAAAGERATLLGISWIRNQRVATIAIRPAEYDPATRQLTTYGRVEVQVSVDGPVAPRPPAEPEDAFESVYRATLVNYEQGKAWRRPAAEGLPTGSAAIIPEGTALPDTSSIFAGHAWVKIAIPKSGMYRINYGQLRALYPFTDSDNIPFTDLRLYAWVGAPNLPETDGCDGCGYRQVALGIEDFGGDGKLSNNQDAFYFYAQGPSDWLNHYDASYADSLFIQNPYETHNYVFLSFQRTSFGDLPFTDVPARIAANLDVTPHDDGTENKPAVFTERLRFETDSPSEYFPSVNTLGNRFSGDQPWNWEKFMWRTLQLGGQFTVIVRTPGADPSVPARFRLRIWGNGRSDLETCNDINAAFHFLDTMVQSAAQGVNYDSVRSSYGDLTSYTVRSFPLLDTLNAVTIRIPQPPNPIGCRVDRSSLGWFELHYARHFEPEADQLSFDSPGNGNVIYRIGPFADRTMPRMFDLTDPFAPREMLTDSALILTNTGFLPIELNEAGRRRYAILPSTSFLRPSAADFSEASGVSEDNLRSTNRAADYLLIYYDGFQHAADSLAAWRQTRLPMAAHAPPYHVTSVPISAIFDQFSGGRADPVAIRNFIRTAFNNWRAGGHAAPSYVTLFGDASFDFRNLLGLAGPGQPAALVPSFENNIVSGVQFATDDWLFNVDVPGIDAIPDLYGARIPAFDVTSANDFVFKKLLPYERTAPTGVYRDRIMLIADDDQQGQADDDLKWTHLQQTATLDSEYVPDHFDRSYIYLHTYPDGPGRTKPAAKAEIKSTINGDGVMIFNYIGHGSPFKLSDESVLIDVDAGTFTNLERLPLFVAASCDVGKFNDPRVQSLGERLLTSGAGGTIGTISATELAFSDFNVRLADDFYDALFQRDPTTGQFGAAVTPALLAAKLLNSQSSLNIQNNQKYGLMGDAAMTLDLPKLWVDIGLFDESGVNPVTQVQAGQVVTVKGTVMDHPGGVPVGYSGVADLLIEDSQPHQTAPPCAYAPNCYKPSYDFRAGAMYRGDVVVSGGTFTTKFVVPMEAANGARGKVRAYVAGFPQQPPQTDGVGSIRTTVAPGTAPTGDTEGPIISLAFPGGVTSVRPDATLRVELSDPSGILTTGHTIQNGIVVTLDDNTTARTDITSTFRYSAGSYTTGAAIFALPNLAAGSHNIKVSAADNLAAGLTAFQHRSNASIDFDVVSTPPILIRNAYLFPNPTESGRRTSGGSFVIDGPGDSVNVLVRIYTISGRMIRELKSLGQYGQVQIPWDGLDAEGHVLANGTYLFKVYVNGRDEKGRSTARQKASREGKIVILNH